MAPILWLFRWNGLNMNICPLDVHIDVWALPTNGGLSPPPQSCHSIELSDLETNRGLVLPIRVPGMTLVFKRQTVAQAEHSKVCCTHKEQSSIGNTIGNDCHPFVHQLHRNG